MFRSIWNSTYGKTSNSFSYGPSCSQHKLFADNDIFRLCLVVRTHLLCLYIYDNDMILSLLQYFNCSDIWKSIITRLDFQFVILSLARVSFLGSAAELLQTYLGAGSKDKNMTREGTLMLLRAAIDSVSIPKHFIPGSKLYLKIKLILHRLCQDL